MALYDVLDLIQANTFRATFLSLLIYSLYFARRDSFTVTLCLMCFLLMIHMLADDLIMGWYDSGFETLAKHAWYLFYATTDFAFIFVAYAIIDHFKIPTQKPATTIIFAHLILGFIQVLRYADRIIFEINMLADIYKVIIPAINSGLTMTVFAYSVGAIIIARNKKRRGE